MLAPKSLAHFNCQGLAAEDIDHGQRTKTQAVCKRLGGEHVVEVLNRLSAQRQAPRYLFVDNGSEFSGRLLDLWAYHCKARIDFSRPGKPTDNCYVESFNGSFRDECLNVHWFETIDDAKAIIESWRRDYNESRPHMALKDIAPQAYARNLGTLNAEN